MGPNTNAPTPTPKEQEISPYIYPKSHKFALIGSIIAALAVIPGWWHLPFNDKGLPISTPIHAPDSTLIIALAVVLALYHIALISKPTHVIGEIAALLIAVAITYLLYTDLRHIMDAYDTINVIGGNMIEPPNAVFAIGGIIGSLAAIIGSAAALLIRFNTPSQHPQQEANS